MQQEDITISTHIKNISTSINESEIIRRIESTRYEILEKLEIQESSKESYDEVRQEKTVSINMRLNEHTTVESFKQLVGRVISLEENFFIANLEDIKEISTQKIAKFNIQNIKIINKELLKEGAVFYWTVGLFRNSKTKELRKKSEIIIKRPLKINVDFIDTYAEEEAERLYSGISWLD